MAGAANPRARARVRNAEVVVADLAVTYRRVRLSSVCECGADLTAAGALHAWELVSQMREGSLVHDVFEASVANTPEIGEGDISYVSYQCAVCGRTLVQGHDVVADARVRADHHERR